MTFGIFENWSPTKSGRLQERVVATGGSTVFTLTKQITMNDLGCLDDSPPRHHVESVSHDDL